MGVIECASNASAWRGYDYFKENKVKNLKIIDDYTFSATVQGTAVEGYSVLVNIKKPKTSTCNCPHANGRRVICKHIVAAYFTMFPDEAKRFYDEAMAYEEEYEQYEEELVKNVRKYILSMKKSELQQSLIELIMDGPQWQYDKFIREHDLESVWRK